MRLRLVPYLALALAALSLLAWAAQTRSVTDESLPLTVGPVLTPVVQAVPVSAEVPAEGPAPVAVPQPDPAWVARTAAAAGIPAPAVTAYARAVLGAPAACGLGWTTLAGIGWVESHHGTIGGRTLDAAGRPSTPIVGPALDGVGPVAAIPADADGRVLHGDPVWDHAVGPMQFLPSTWSTWGRDGDGDGTLDPQDLDDAAAAAAAYLCDGRQDLTEAAGWSAAVLSYNHSGDYLRSVHSAATAYAERTR